MVTKIWFIAASIILFPIAIAAIYNFYRGDGEIYKSYLEYIGLKKK